MLFLKVYFSIIKRIAIPTYLAFELKVKHTNGSKQTLKMLTTFSEKQLSQN